MGIKMLSRRLEALERSWANNEEACNTKILNALHKISEENLELLINATLALRQGRELTESEMAAKQAYAAVLETEFRGSGLTLQRIPSVPELISVAVTRSESLEELGLVNSARRVMAQGYDPTAEQVAALSEHRARLQAQYQRVGFDSEAEFAAWSVA